MRMENDLLREASFGFTFNLYILDSLAMCTLYRMFLIMI